MLHSRARRPPQAAIAIGDKINGSRGRNATDIGHQTKLLHKGRMRQAQRIFGGNAASNPQPATAERGQYPLTAKPASKSGIPQ